jgi:hypothetical protein
MSIAVIFISVCQGLLSVAALFAVGVIDTEAIPIALFLLGAAVSWFVAIRGFPRHQALVAAGANVSAVVCYCLMPAIFGGEYEVGFDMMRESGLILLIVGPPAINAVLLLIAGTAPAANPSKDRPETFADRH